MSELVSITIESVQEHTVVARYTSIHPDCGNQAPTKSPAIAFQMIVEAFQNLKNGWIYWVYEDDDMEAGYDKFNKEHAEVLLNAHPAKQILEEWLSVLHDEGDEEQCLKIGNESIYDIKMLEIIDSDESDIDCRFTFKVHNKDLLYHLQLPEGVNVSFESAMYDFARDNE